MKTIIWSSLIISYMLFGCTSRPVEKESSVNAFSDQTLQAIYQAADERNATELLPYFDHTVAAYRMAAARCAGSMTDSLFKEALSKLLKDPVPYVRLHAAFAVGQYRNQEWLPALEKAIKKATIPEIKAEVLTAIGKCSNRQATEYLVFHEPNTAIEEAGKIWGVYYASLRNNLRESDLRVVVAHLNSQENETRLAAAHVLARQNDFTLDDFRSKMLSVLENEKSGEIRSVLTRALLHTSNSREHLLKLSVKDPDPRVRAEALKGISTPISGQALTTVLQSLEDGSAWVAMEAASVLARTNIQMNDLAKVEFLLKTSPIPEVRAVIASAFIGLDTPDRGWSYWKGLSESKPDQALMVQFLPSQPDVIDTLRKYALDDSPLGTACFGKLITYLNKDSAIDQSWIEMANEAFSKKLLAQTYLASENLLELPSLEGLDSMAVLRCYQSFAKEGQAESRNAVGKVLLKLDISLPPLDIEVHKNIDWSFVERIPKSSKARLFTKEGVMNLSLLVEDAPGSVSNFISHAQKGTYDGTLFHRVVPVFVTQGGGPRGDGFGSTDHTIRSEFSNLQFGPGVVGLASAGMDTESCQFFITHLSTPHLNGRYTIIGTLDGGLETLEKIKSNSRIDSVRIVF